MKLHQPALSSLLATTLTPGRVGPTSMYILILIIIAIAFAFLAIRDFKLGVTVLLALLPAYLLRFSLGPIPSTLLEVFVLIIIGVWLIKEQGWRLDFLRTLGAYRIPMLLLLAASCFAVAVAPNPIAALGIWKAFYVKPIALFFVFRSTFTERQDWLRALRVLGVTVIGLAVFAVFQRLTGLGIPEPWDVELRATSIFDFPNAVGLFVAPIVSAFLVLISVRVAPSPLERAGVRTGGEDTVRVVGGVAAFSGLLACFLSQTEGAYVAIPAALFIVFLLSKVPTKIKLSIALLAVVLGISAFAASSTIREKLLLQDFSGQVRLSQWRETTAMLKDHWLTGAGLHGYPTVFAAYHDPRLYEIFQYPHNILLNFWVELGLLGVIALMVFAVAIGRVGFLRRSDGLVLCAVAALLTMFIHGLVDVPFFKNDLAILTAFFLAMTLHPDPHPLATL